MSNSSGRNEVVSVSNLASLAQQGKFISFDWAVGDYQLLGILEEIFEGGLEDIHLRGTPISAI